jgi:hypothetical protein
MGVRRTLDVAMTHKLDADDFFIHRVQFHCAERRLNFFLIEPLWVETFLEKLLSGQVATRVLLNMHSEHHDPTEVYHRLVRAAHERGTAVIDPPDVALAAFDKGRVHPRLAAAGLPVPPTVVVRGSDRTGFHLSEAEKEMLGVPFIVKPSVGYGRRGVVTDARSEADIERSAAIWPGADYLLQRVIVPRQIHEEPAYFRVYYVFGSTFCVWWNCYTDRYRSMASGEEEAHGLGPLRTLVQRVAELTGMRFFSTEVALTEAGEFVLIDYVNDQCHMLCQSASPRIGVPDDLVAAIAQRLVEGATTLIPR